MRYYQFKLTESANDVENTLDDIKTAGGNAAEENPIITKKITAQLKKIYDKLLKSSKEKPPVEEDTATLSANPLEAEMIQAANALLALIKSICGEKSPEVCGNKEAIEASQSLKRLESVIPNAFKQDRRKVRDQEFSKDQTFITDFETAVRKVSAKTTGTLEALENHYQEKYKEALKKDKELIELKKAPKLTQVEKAVNDAIKGVFSDPVFKAQNRGQKERTRKLVLNFLNDCVKGIIKLGPLMDAGQGNVIEEFKKTKYEELTPMFNELLGKVPSGSGAGSWGPAELALSVVGTPVEKAEKGDLNIGGGRKIELKASRKATSGGRVNTPAIGTGLTGKSLYQQAFLNTFNKKGLKVKATKVKYNKKVKPNKKYPDGLSPTEIKYTSFGPTLINQVLNPFIKRKNIDKNEIIDFVRNVALAPVLDEYKDRGRELFNAEKTVNTDSTINGKSFVAEYLNMVMQFYVETDEVEEVLIISPVSGNYHVVNAKQTDTIHKKIASGDIQLSTTYLDFTDNQSKASPQLGTE